MKGQKIILNVYIYIYIIYQSHGLEMGKVDMGIRSMIKGFNDFWENYRDLGWGHPPNGGDTYLR